MDELSKLIAIMENETKIVRQAVNSLEKGFQSLLNSNEKLRSIMKELENERD